MPALLGCPQLPSVSRQPGTDIPHCSWVLRAGVTRKGWELPPDTALAVLLGAHRGKATAQGSLWLMLQVQGPPA